MIEYECDECGSFGAWEEIIEFCPMCGRLHTWHGYPLEEEE